MGLALFFAIGIIFFGNSLFKAFLGKTVVPEPSITLIDQAGALTLQQRKNVEQQIQALRLATGAELAVVLITRPQQGSLAQWAQAMGNRRQLGRLNVGDGILLSIAIQTGEIRLDVGCGLEATFSNQDAQAVVENIIEPQWRTQGLASALQAGITGIVDKVVQADLPPFGTPLPGRPIWYGSARSPGCQLPAAR
jgi:uncharacterized protein